MEVTKPHEVRLVQYQNPEMSLGKFLLTMLLVTSGESIELCCRPAKLAGRALTRSGYTLVMVVF
jgi:hypothetical protein